MSTASVATLNPRALSSRIVSAPWSMAAGVSLLLLAILAVVSGQNPLLILGSNAQTASFVVLVALAQMVVVTAGEGAIDLSIPNTISISVYVTTILQQGDNARLPMAIAAALVVGLAVGAVNGAFVTMLRVPAIVATLAVGFVVNSLVNVLSNVPGRGQASAALQAFARGDLFGISYLVLFALAALIVMGFYILRTTPGLRLVATGQSFAAAEVGGLKPRRSRMSSFVISGLIAAIAGVLLCGYSNGAFLGIGDPYQIASIAAVVLGGTLMSGGRPSAVGCLFGALFLAFVTTLTNVLAVPAGVRWLIQGLIIIGALALPKFGRSSTS